MSRYIKYIKNGGKTMYFMIKEIGYWLNIMKFGTRLKRH